MLDLSAAKALCVKYEGLSLEPYHCPSGFPTIGYGHLLSYDKWSPLTKYAPITEEQALDFLEKDLRLALRGATKQIPVPQTGKQWNALTDFVFNLGIERLRVSTLRRKILRGESPYGEFTKWVYAGGVKLRGLVRRRTEEQDQLYFG